jgi:hypothetical protein
MKQILSWCIGPLLLGGAIGALLGVRSAEACRPQQIYWALEKADPQPEEALPDAARWPQSGLLSSGSLSFQGPDTAELRLEFEQ